MQFGTIPSILVAVIFVESLAAGLPLAGVVEIGLRLILNNLKRNGNITHDQISITLPENKKDIMVGSLTLDDFIIYGMKNMHFTTEVKDVPTEDPEFSKVNVSFALSWDKLGLDTGYDVDIGILNEIPIYGVGKIKLEISRVEVGLNAMLSLKSDLSNKNISDLNLQIAFHDSPAELTGFWKNSKVSQFITGIINILEKLFCMWFTYEKECVNCVLAKLIEFGVNQYLRSKEGNLVVDCECLKNNKYKLKNVLENIGNSYVHEGIEGVDKYLGSKEVYDILLDLYKNIADIIVNESYKL